MPRHQDPDLEERILKAAQALWKRGGDKALTLRAVARSAGTNTPAVYRRFKDRRDLVRGLLMRTVSRVGKTFDAHQTIEEMAESYVNLALEEPHEYELFYTYGHELSPARGSGRPKPIRESRPNFALLEQRLVKRLGGSAKDHTQLALALWALMHGSTMLLLSKSIPDGHEPELRAAFRTAIKSLLEGAGRFSEPIGRKRRAPRPEPAAGSV
jgi:AcrR family transcriptional regulator